MQNLSADAVPAQLPNAVINAGRQFAGESGAQPFRMPQVAGGALAKAKLPRFPCDVERVGSNVLPRLRRRTQREGM